jgi:hypothetical protein
LFATWFLVDDDAPLSDAARELLPFDEGTHRVASRDVPEAVIGFPRRSVTHAYDSAGFHLTSLTTGQWAQGLHQLPYQDMLVGRRR